MTTALSVRRTVRDALLASLHEASAYNSMDVVAPTAVLWPDEDGQWASVVPLLRSSAMVLKLGDFDPQRETGPAQWIRLRAYELSSADSEAQIVVYLPGVSRRTLTDAQSLDAPLRCLASLVVRSNVFSQQNSTDWTPYAYFANQVKGLGLDVVNDGDTRAALANCLPTLLDIPVDELRRKRLSGGDFHQLLVKDPVRSILKWLDDPTAFEAEERAQGSWDSFAQLVKSGWKLSIEDDGPLAAAEALGSQRGRWPEVWARFLESPIGYPGVVELLGRARPDTLPDPLVWPQDNADAEAEVKGVLAGLQAKSVDQIRSSIDQLEQAHAPRRDSVWGQLGRAPMADVVGQLAELSALSRHQLQGQTASELSASYATKGWKVDDLFTRVLGALPAGQLSHVNVSMVAEALYRPWLEASTNIYQDAWAADPAWIGPQAGVSADLPEGTCAMFVDGLRMDVAARVATVLADSGLDYDLGWGQTAIPTVTSTCKPALTPLAPSLTGGPELNPSFSDSKPWTQEGFRKRLPDAGWHFVPQDETGDPSSRGWTEGGDIDKLGHDVGLKLVRQLDSEATSIANRILELLAAGWRQVVVVTDHGWLLLPSKLPKHSLAEHLTVVRKGRCARMVDGAPLPTGVMALPWRHDYDAKIAVAPSIYAFEDGKVYEHGGISLQECVVPRLTVRSTTETASGSMTVDISWTALACVVIVHGAPDGARVDLRSRPIDPGSSLVGGGKPLKAGRARILAEDEHEGAAVVLVVLGPDGGVVIQRPTVVPAG